MLGVHCSCAVNHSAKIIHHNHQYNYQTYSSCFSLIGSTVSGFHLRLKESLPILKLKTSPNAAKESIPSGV